ncbi:LLM class F420-dependent oxidoreductase [Cryptosporangium aurantiacum]|uniref:Probable F420-dependent oxidoreductase, Rv3093c family n=1 Tax=Cryptosporangium aurantiacum TaxID=134849 RepID=A0A1M7JFU7_9ACTN|nr:LLM class F420-dependent oxidoreductase [Cryptosporangium aurantiacum]SHM51894.1 probable F420-dependent oxidoreductase, Rv3093c family [Cryptosporangium aurantiacum]
MPTLVPRWGLTLPLDGVPLHRHRPLIDAVAELGFTDVWSAETAGADAFTPLALFSSWSPTLRLGTAIAPAQTRGPALLAMSTAALADAAPGRFALGLGASSPAIVESWNGLPFEQPYQRVRDTLRFLRRALAGEKIDEAYETFTVRGFRLQRVPEQQPPILLAALRPGMLRLAGQEADGAILNWLAVTDVPKAVAELGTAEKEVAARIFVCPTTDRQFVGVLARRLISSYLTVPAYRAFHEWLGRGDALGPMWDAWEAGDRAAANAAIPDEVVDALVVHGTPDECRAHLRAYVDAGVTTPVAALLPTPDIGTPEGVLAAIRAVSPA